MGGLLSNIFDKNACVIRKTRFNIFWKFPVYFRIFSFINKNDIFRKENFIFEWKVIFNIDFYDPKDLKKHSCLIFKGLFFLTTCPTEPVWKLILGGKTIVDIAGKVIELHVVITTGAFEDIMIDKCHWTWLKRISLC